jgi:hypothetical protein
MLPDTMANLKGKTVLGDRLAAFPIRPRVPLDLHQRLDQLG